MADHDYSREESTHIPGKHRGPRFTWNPAYEVTFFRSLCESVQLGLREGMTFKAEAWDRAAQALIDRHNAYANKGHLINKSDNARKKFRMWRSLREHPDFLYNPSTKTITGSEEAWRKHIEREPLSRSLKGRPFEYEDFYEILFPDVIGTGGAPKRITNRKRKTDTSMISDTPDNDQTMVSTTEGTPGPVMISLLADATYGGANANASTASTSAPSQQAQQLQLQAQAQAQAAHRQPNTTAPTPSPVMSHTQQTQRPTSTAIPPRTAMASTSALTPPDETAPHSRQRFLVPGEQSSQHAPQPPPTFQPPPRPNSGPDKRRKGKADGYLNVHPPQLPPNNTHNTAITLPATPAPTATSTSGTHPPPSSTAVTGAIGPSASSSSSSHNNQSQQHQQTDALLALAEALRRPARPAYSEQAVDIFFRDFCDEDMDFQIKMADKMFAADENKAMVFVKMSADLRKHWVKKLREFHLKQT